MPGSSQLALVGGGGASLPPGLIQRSHSHHGLGGTSHGGLSRLRLGSGSLPHPAHPLSSSQSQSWGFAGLSTHATAAGQAMAVAEIEPAGNSPVSNPAWPQALSQLSAINEGPTPHGSLLLPRIPGTSNTSHLDISGSPSAFGSDTGSACTGVQHRRFMPNATAAIMGAYEPIQVVTQRVLEELAADNKRLKDTTAKLADSLIDGTVKAFDTGKETVHAGAKWMKWGVTKVLISGGRRKGEGLLAQLQRGNAQSPGRLAAKVEQQRTEGELCPRVMFLGVSNSMADNNDTTCRISIYSPYWVDNRTGFDLVFQDLDVPVLVEKLMPLLVYNTVRAPGYRQDGQHEAKTAREIKHLQDSQTDTSPSALARFQRAVLLVNRSLSVARPALLNEQNSTAFKLNDAVGNTDWCTPFRIAAAGHKLDVSLRGKKVLMPGLQQPSNMGGLGLSCFKRSKEPKPEAGVSLQPDQSSATATSQMSSAPEHSNTSAENLGDEVERGKMLKKLNLKKLRHIQRMFNFAVEIWPGPDATVFCDTKIVTVKNKYIMLNDTGLAIEFKQKGTPDPSTKMYGEGKRFAGTLAHNTRAAIHWDNQFLEQELVIRPLGSDWYWSGSFKLPESEEYFGLRIRNRVQGYAIIPVNITVGSAGSVLVTLKSERSVPPYLIINRCKDVVIRLKQAGVRPRGHRLSLWDGWDVVQPNTERPMPYAWDEPSGRHTVQAIAHAKNLQPNLTLLQEDARLIPMDEMQEEVMVLHVHQTYQDVSYDPGMVLSGSRPSVANRAGLSGVALQQRGLMQQSILQARGSQDLAALNGERMARMARVLARECAKKVYVSIYAEGPTRVLCFAEEKANITSVDDMNSVLNLAVRLKQLELKMTDVDDELAKHLHVGERLRQETAAGNSSAMPTVVVANPIGSVGGLNSTLGRGSMGTVGSQRMFRLGDAPSEAASTPMSRPTVETSRLWAAAFQRAAGAATAGSSHMSFTRAGTLPLASTGAGPSLFTAGSTSATLPQALSQPTQLEAVSENQDQLLRTKSLVKARSFASLALATRQGTADRPSYQVTEQDLSASGLQDATPAIASTVPAMPLMPLGPPAAFVTDLLQYPSGTEVPIGGDLKFRVIGAKGLPRQEHGMHTFVKVSVKGQVSITKLVPYINSPEWQHEGQFRDVPASQELLLEVLAIQGVQPGQGGADADADDLPDMSSGAKFLGCAEVSLQETLPSANVSSVPLTLDEPFVVPLRRRVGNQIVRGELLLALEWQFTREGLLLREVQLLEHLLAQKVELVARLRPVLAETAQTWMTNADPVSGVAAPCGVGMGAAGTDGFRAMHCRPVAATPVPQPGSTAAPGPAYGTFTAGKVSGGTAALAGLGGSGSLGGDEDEGLLPLLNAQQISESYFVNLDVSVMEVRGLAVTTGWQQDLINALAGNSGGQYNTQLHSLPLVVVQVSCFDSLHTVACEQPNLNPHFVKNNCCFENLALGNVLGIKVWIRTGFLRERRVLLAEGELRVGAIPSASPTFAWVPLWQPRAVRARQAAAEKKEAKQAGLGPVTPPPPFGQNGPAGAVQVFVRLQISKPPARGVKLGLTLDLAGVGLCAKSALYELFNFTLQTVRASMLKTARDLQLTVVVDSFQLDNQLLETLRPVVLSPHEMAQGLGAGRIPKGGRFNHQSLQRHMSADTARPLLSFQVVHSFAAAPQQLAAPVVVEHQQQQRQPRPFSLPEEHPVPHTVSDTETHSTPTGSHSNALPRGRRSLTAGAHPGVARTASWQQQQQQQSALSNTRSPMMSPRAPPGTDAGCCVDAPEGACAGSGYVGGGLGMGESAAGGGATILSFKKLEVDLGPLDLITDQAFLEALYLFIRSLPLADVWQDEQWKAGMELMQGLHSVGSIASAAAIGAANPLPPRGVAALKAGHHSSSVHGHRASSSSRRTADVLGSQSVPHEIKSTGQPGLAAAHADGALGWLLAKEEEELSMMKGQSSSWFFIEELSIKLLSVNVTLSLTSKMDVGTPGITQGRDANPAKRTILKGVLTRLSGSTGFQLINVSNAPISLQGHRWTSLLVNKVGLMNLLWRYYSWPAMAEARKLLGGAGPAIAAVPASLLWAGISIVELGHDVATRRVGPGSVLPRLGFYFLTASGQVVGVISRSLGALMVVLPIQREGWLSDNEALRRFTRRPQTVSDALYLGQKDFVVGFVAALAGLILDPYEGARSNPGWLGALGAFLGMAKAIVGLGVRPAAGIFETGSKMLQGMGLLCLGKRGIQGKLVRRVMAPGTPMANMLGAGVDLGGPTGPTESTATRAQLLAAWQSALVHIAPELAEDVVVDVLAARRTRVVLLTNRHIAYLLARHHHQHAGGGQTSQATATYKLKWVIPNELVDNVRGVERSHRISVEFRRPVKVGRLLLKLPLRKGMRTDDAEGHQNLIFRLNRHIGKLNRSAMLLGEGAHPGGPRQGSQDTASLTIGMAPPAPTIS